MDIKIGMLALAVICAVALAIGFLRRRAEIFLNFAVRTILGGIAIYAVNLLLSGLGVTTLVGINFISLLTVGTLGTGGFALLYGILFYNML